jgi:glycerol-3-phosphate cytidylyltransferase
MKKVIITYGTFDLFHVGHLKLLNRLRDMGDYLIAGVSTDEFNMGKGKKSLIKFQDRFDIVSNLKSVDLAIPESSWEQKINDIKKYNVSVFAMGSDWEGKFDHLKEYCEVVYLDRTDGISSTEIRNSLSLLDKNHINDLKKALDIVSNVIEKFD